MTANEWWMVVGGALLFGGMAGGMTAARLQRTRLAAQVRRVTAEMEQKHAATAEQLRSAQATAKRELEKERSAFKRQLAQAGEAPRAAASRAEERLRAAYDELDRLRAGTQGGDTSTADIIDGFQATRPMRQGM